MKINFIVCLTVILLSLDNNVVAGKRDGIPGFKSYLRSSGHVATPASSELAQLTQKPAFKLENSLLQLKSESFSLCSRHQGMQETLQDFCHQIVDACTTMLATIDRYCKRVSISTIDEHLKEGFISRALEFKNMISTLQKTHMASLAQLINPYVLLTPPIYESKEGQLSEEE